jgi:hypothetical protein
MTSAITKTPLRSSKGTVPTNTRIEIAEMIDLGHYSSALAYYDLRLASGEVIFMVKIYDDLEWGEAKKDALAA